MKYYIRASRSKHDDIKKSEDEWKKAFAARYTLYHSQTDNYLKALRSYQCSIEDELKHHFSYFIDKLPGLKISYSTEMHNIYITYEGQQPGQFKFSTFNCNYSISLSKINFTDYKPNVNVNIHSSNLTVLDSSCLDILHNMYELTEAISKFDWKSFLIEAYKYVPKENQYVAIKDPQYDIEWERPNFELYYLEDNIDNLIGKDLWVKIDWGCAFIHFIQRIFDGDKSVKFICMRPEFGYQEDLDAVINDDFEEYSQCKSLSELADEIPILTKPFNQLDLITKDELIELFNKYK